MPLKDCIRNGDKLYCWNSETKEIDVYTRKTISLNNCPAEIIRQLMDLLDKKAKGEECLN
ncbi:MAG: hypothetical protein FWC36_00305 [Spirochaetes bacterium]|nr:hypothetical protein [Spirochaetota bacterium]